MAPWMIISRSRLYESFAKSFYFTFVHRMIVHIKYIRRAVLMRSIEMSFLIGRKLLVEDYSAGKNICRKLYFRVSTNICSKSTIEKLEESVKYV